MHMAHSLPHGCWFHQRTAPVTPRAQHGRQCAACAERTTGRPTKTPGPVRPSRDRPVLIPSHGAGIPCPGITAVVAQPGLVFWRRRTTHPDAASERPQRQRRLEVRIHAVGVVVEGKSARRLIVVYSPNPRSVTRYSRKDETPRSSLALDAHCCCSLTVEGPRDQAYLKKVFIVPVWA